MIEIILSIIIVCIVLQSIVIYTQAKKISTNKNQLEDHDVSIRRLNHRIIGDQRPVKGIKLPSKMI